MEQEVHSLDLQISEDYRWDKLAPLGWKFLTNTTS
jgi:hypothetical protein